MPWYLLVMFDISSVLVEIQRRYAVDWEGQAPTEADLLAWSGGSGQALAHLYDQIATKLAVGYHEKRFSFEFCDEVVNHLYGMMIGQQAGGSPPPWPTLFFRVFEAFDAGEFASPNLPTHDPVKTYTDPEIAEIVRKL
ncbi:MAG: hypothetical protein CMI50_00435 [Paracoccus sp.]|nr:hypothetical protein [Paracoccus sp. (in: a-proteobacteria)]